MKLLQRGAKKPWLQEVTSECSLHIFSHLMHQDNQSDPFCSEIVKCRPCSVQLEASLDSRWQRHRQASRLCGQTPFERSQDGQVCWKKCCQDALPLSE